MALGINETRPNMAIYAAAVHGAGLLIEHAFTPSLHGKNVAELTALARHLGLIAPRFSLRHPWTSLRNLRTHRGWLKMVKRAGYSAALAPPPELADWDAWTYRLMLPDSQELILVARKPDATS
jgi:hypothetical protein